MEGKPSQRWILAPGVTPGDADAKPTFVKSAVKLNASCWQANNCGFGSSITCDANTNNNYVPVKYVDGCKPLPSANNNTKDTCAHNQAFQFNANGTIALAMRHTDKGAPMHHCLQVDDKDKSIGLQNCQPPPTPGKPAPANQPSQKWTVVSNSDGSVTIKQGELCVDNNYRPTSLPPA